MQQHYSYRAAHKATEKVYGQSPDYTREGGSIPVTLDFANILNLNILLLPVGRGDDGAHSMNEKLDTDNYIRVSAKFLWPIALKPSGNETPRDILVRTG